MTSTASHSIAKSAECIIGASLSVFTAIILSEFVMPAVCCIAPDMPKAMYNLGDTEFPVCPT